MGNVSRRIGYWTSRIASLARQRPIIHAFIATGGVIAGVVGVGEIFPGASKAAQASVVSAVADPATLFDSRSPGNRRYGWLQQTKHPRTNMEATPPSERVLTAERRRPVAPAVPGAGLPVIPGVPFDIGPNGTPEAPFDVALTDTPSPVALFGGTPSVGGSVIGGVVPGSGGGGSSGGGTPGGGNPVVSPPVVPEPATWLMIFIGLFGIGAVMRRRPSRRVHGIR